MSIKDLLKKRETLAKQSVERQLADLDAQILAAQTEEKAKAEAERAEAEKRALAEARAVRDAAQEQALGHLRAFAASVADVERAEGVLRGLGVFQPSGESDVDVTIRLEARRALVRMERRKEWAAQAKEQAAQAAEWAGLAPEERQRRTAQRQLDQWQAVRDAAHASGRREDAADAARHIAELRAELGLKAPLGERVLHPAPTAEEVEDESRLAVSRAWHEVAEQYRAQERERSDAQAQA